MAATLLQLRNRVFIYLNDLQDPITGSADRYQTPAANQVINDCIKHYVKILDSNYQGYLSANHSLDIIGGVREYPLPPAFRSPIYQIRRTINQTNYFLDAFQPYNSILDEVSVSNESWAPTYWLEGNRILFSQIPSASEIGACIIKYQLKVADLLLDATQLPDELYDMEDCVVLKAVNRLLKAKDVSGALKNVGGWESELMIAEQAFYMQVGNRFIKSDKPLPVATDDNFFF